MKTIEISYSELRVYTDKVMTIIGNSISIDKMNLSSGIETDLGTTGDDVQELLMDIDKKFSIDFNGFDFLTYFNDEGIFCPIICIWSILFEKKKENFTVGDLVVWVINKEFIKRDRVYFKLI